MLPVITHKPIVVRGVQRFFTFEWRGPLYDEVGHGFVDVLHACHEEERCLARKSGTLGFRRVVGKLSSPLRLGQVSERSEESRGWGTRPFATLRVTVQWEFARIYPAKSKRAMIWRSNGLGVTCVAAAARPPSSPTAPNAHPISVLKPRQLRRVDALVGRTPITTLIPGVR